MTIHNIKLGSRISAKDLAEVESRVKQKMIKAVRHPTLPFTIYNYSTKTQYERLWDQYTIACRGLIIDDDRNIIARPFSKIFNYGEPDESGEEIENTTERPEFYHKLDGVLGITYPNDDEIAVATRGSFTNPQSQFATQWLQDRIPPSKLKPEYTYLFEIIHPDSRIVINYDFEGLVLLAVLSKDGTHELNHIKEGLRLGMGFARDMLFTDILQAVSFLQEADGREIEGFVAKFSNGYRIKMKAEDYVRMHRMIFHTSSKDIWLALQENRLESIYEVLPDEMYDWVRDIEVDLVSQYNKLMETANYIAKTALRRYSSKEDIARYIRLFPEKAIAFQIANGKKSKAETLVWKMIKPKYEKFSDKN
ncbi:MAG: T4 RnlA family RNA ligase [Candidatus Omnitrophica bacterium]|nr:T4 RnlA family RNA ligase [Candidatus Omnitrophota bacterium]